MGTTLQNGVYLPNEGERNCYNGLKTNWEILDQKVADVTALQQAVAGALHREIVESLPTTDIDPNTIYMILSGTSATENVYDEYMYVNNAWELIGTSATDLTNYYTKAEVDGKLLLKASASDLTSHTGDTTIHVTASDKNKWNNQTYVFRYSSTALVASSTNSNALLDNTDNLKVGDKVIDSSGVLFSITAIDTANSTFTVGSALVDLALDANVVHTSGNEIIGGQKTFTNSIILQNSDTSGISRDHLCKSQVAVLGDAVSGDSTKYRFVDKNDNEICYIRQRKLRNSNTDMSFCVNNIDNDNNSISAEINFIIDRNNDPRISPSITNYISLGRQTFRWKNVFSNQINGLTPSALGMPDLSNGIDISSYLDVSQSSTNYYTPPANGWISISINTPVRDSIQIECGGGFRSSVLSCMEPDNTNNYIASIIVPCIKNDTATIYFKSSHGGTIKYAYFYPCLGNV